MLSRVLRGVLIGALVLPTGVCGADEAAGGEPGRLTSPRVGHAATLLQNGDIVVSGGSDGDQAMAGVELVDADTSTSMPLADLATARTGHSATVLESGLILIAGGTSGDRTLASAELYDPLTGAGQPAGSMRWARAGHEAVILGDGSVLLVGGVHDGKPVTRAELYQPTTATFEPTTKSNAGHRDPAVARLPNGRVLVSGAVAGKQGQSAEMFIPAKGRWKAVKGSPPLHGHTASALPDGRVVLAGGRSGKADSGAVFLLDPAKGKANRIGTLAEPRSGHTASLLPDGRLLVLGGSVAGLETEVVEVFDVAAGTSSVIETAILPRTGHTSTMLADGRVVIIGGGFGGLAFDDILLFDPAADTVLPPDQRDTTSRDGPEVEFTTEADLLGSFGAPDAFTIYFFDEPAADGSMAPVAMEEWVYHDQGVAYAIDGDAVVASEPVSVEPAADLQATPYEPAQFGAYMSLEQVLDSTGIDDYIVGTVDAAVDDGELFLGDRLVWGLKDGQLRYVRALALASQTRATEEP